MTLWHDVDLVKIPLAFINTVTCMNFSLLSQHNNLISIVFGVVSIAFALSFGLGDVKTWAEISWLDVLGEGGIAVLTLVWVFFLLVSRPPGRVTRLLTLGLSCYMFSALLDMFDEFVHYADAAAWLSMIESIPALIGMVVMTWGLYLWHQEQLILNMQLQRREVSLREHDQIDFITKLYRADYMRGQIASLLKSPDTTNFSIAMLDMDDFDLFNRSYGVSEGDRLLREISELILMNLRQSDLACRYAGDRFILLLPETNLETANEIAQQIRTAIKHLAFKTTCKGNAVYHTLTFAADIALIGDKVDSIIGRVNRQLDLCKEG